MLVDRIDELKFGKLQSGIMEKECLHVRANYKEIEYPSVCLSQAD